MIALLSINLKDLVKFSHAVINQKDCNLIMYFHHLGTVMHSSTVCKTSNIYFVSCCPMHACTPLFMKASTHFPWIQTMLSWPNLYSPLKIVFMNTTLFSNKTVLLAQKKNLLTHCHLSPSYMSYQTNDTRCFLFCPVTILVNESAELFLDLFCTVNVSTIAIDLLMAS